MAHGFGVSTNELKAQELRYNAAAKGYDSQYRDDVVTIADLSGLTVAVNVDGGKYCVKGKRNDIRCAEANSAMKRVAKAFSVLKRI